MRAVRLAFNYIETYKGKKNETKKRHKELPPSYEQWQRQSNEYGQVLFEQAGRVNVGQLQ